MYHDHHHDARKTEHRIARSVSHHASLAAKTHGEERGRLPVLRRRRVKVPQQVRLPILGLFRVLPAYLRKPRLAVAGREGGKARRDGDRGQRRVARVRRDDGGENRAHDWGTGGWVKRKRTARPIVDRKAFTTRNGEAGASSLLASFSNFCASPPPWEFSTTQGIDSPAPQQSPTPARAPRWKRRGFL